MAFTRKFLSALGIEADKVDEIMTAHVEVVDGLKSERDAYKADADKLVDVEKKLADANDKIAKNGDGETVSKADFDKINKELTELKAKETTRAKEHAFRELLKDAGVSEKRIDAVVRVSKLDEIELDKDGKIKDADKRSESIKAEWADFIVSTEEKGADTKTPPDNNGGNSKKYEDMSMEEYIAARKKG